MYQNKTIITSHKNQIFFQLDLKYKIIDIHYFTTWITNATYTPKRQRKIHQVHSDRHLLTQRNRTVAYTSNTRIRPPLTHTTKPGGSYYTEASCNHSFIQTLVNTWPALRRAFTHISRLRICKRRPVERYTHYFKCIQQNESNITIANMNIINNILILTIIKIIINNLKLFICQK